MKAIISTSTGAYSYEKAVKIADEMNKSDDWDYVVTDCMNGLGRIDVYDEDGELIVKGFMI